MRLNDSPSAKTDWSLPKSGIQGLGQQLALRNWFTSKRRELTQPDLYMKDREEEKKQETKSIPLTVLSLLHT